MRKLHRCGSRNGAACDRVIKETEAVEASASILASMDERDVVRLMKWRFANLCSDGSSN
jgi:hypothetical protein